MIWRALQFGFPLAAWLLFLVIPIGWLFYFLYRYREKKLKGFASQPVLEVICEKRDPVIYWVKAFFYCLAWVGAVLALMQPKGNEHYLSTSQKGQIAISKKAEPQKTAMRKKAHEVIFLIDASASMNVADLNEKTRLDISKEIIDSVIRDLKGENVSLYAFTSSTIQVVPSTLDYLFTRLMLQQISINEGETEGTDFRQALDYLRQRYLSQSSSKTKTLIIFSDGGDTHLEGLPADQRPTKIAEIASSISKEDKNLRVFAVGIGTKKGKKVPGVLYKSEPVASALEEPLLRQLSINGKGELYLAEQMEPLQISKKLSQQISRQEAFEETSIEVSSSEAIEGIRLYDEYFQYPLAIAILALMGGLAMPDTYKRRVFGK